MYGVINLRLVYYHFVLQIKTPATEGAWNMESFVSYA